MSRLAFTRVARFARRSFCSRAAVPTLALVFAPALSAVTVDFGDVNLLTPPAQVGAGGVYYNGSDGAGDWSSGGVGFNLNYNTLYGSWDGFAYSTTTDTTTPGFFNQYSAIPGGGAGGSGAYAVAYAGYVEPATISFPGGAAPVSVALTNTTYAALDMRTGTPPFSKKFGGASGNDPDYFTVTFTGFDAFGATTGAVSFDLADFRFADNTQDYIVDDWRTVDLAGLGSVVARIELGFASSDLGFFGINTPTYVALDDLVYVPTIPESSSAAALAGASVIGLAVWRRRPTIVASSRL